MVINHIDILLIIITIIGAILLLSYGINAYMKHKTESYNARLLSYCRNESIRLINSAIYGSIIDAKYNKNAMAAVEDKDNYLKAISKTDLVIKCYLDVRYNIKYRDIYIEKLIKDKLYKDKHGKYRSKVSYFSNTVVSEISAKVAKEFMVEIQPLIYGDDFEYEYSVSIKLEYTNITKHVIKAKSEDEAYEKANIILDELKSKYVNLGDPQVTMTVINNTDNHIDVPFSNPDTWE